MVFTSEHFYRHVLVMSIAISIAFVTRFIQVCSSDTRVYEPQIRARLGTTAHFCGVVVLN